MVQLLGDLKYGITSTSPYKHRLSSWRFQLCVDCVSMPFSLTKLRAGTASDKTSLRSPLIFLYRDMFTMGGTSFSRSSTTSVFGGLLFCE